MEYNLKSAKDALETVEKLGIDFYRFWPNFTKNSTRPSIISKNIYRYEDENLGIWEDVSYNPYSNMGTIIDDSISHGGKKALTDYLKKVEQNIDNCSIGNSYFMTASSVPWEENNFYLLKTVLKNTFGKNFFVCGCGGLPFPAYVKWLPLYLELMIDDPSLINRHNEDIHYIWFKCLKEQVKIGVSGIIDGYDFAFNTAPLFSPEHFKKYFLPYIKINTNYCHENNVFYIKHEDGNILPFIEEYLVDSGIDAFQAINKNAGMDIFYLKRKYGRQICLIGNIDQSSSLVYGTKTKIKNEVKELIKKCAKGGGFALSSNCSIGDEVSVERYKYMLKILNKYGEYPI